MPKIRASNLSAHKALVRTQLLDAFEELLLAQSYEEVSIAAVAARAGVARNTVYNYASDKSELLTAAAQRHIGRLLLPLQQASQVQDPALRLRGMLEVAMSSFLDSPISPTVFKALMHHGTEADLDVAAQGSQELIPFLMEAIDDGVQAGAFRAFADGDFLFDLIAGVLVTAVENVLESPETGTQRISEAIDFVMGALRA
ncbi:TetR/AcrR family transcriptional regulator [Galactobacter valiniphilus]|uniref:TetR/AcrR family transcriptional regulator n=1 Tax=Galactobacter valiniphilus TaxID=2676122 RepID=UPI0037362190